MPLISTEEYTQKRREGTTEDVTNILTSELIPTDQRRALIELRHNRISLANTYEEDGARGTAAIIRSVDVDIIDRAILNLTK